MMCSLNSMLKQLFTPLLETLASGSVVSCETFHIVGRLSYAVTCLAKRLQFNRRCFCRLCRDQAISQAVHHC